MCEGAALCYLTERNRAGVPDRSAQRRLRQGSSQGVRAAHPEMVPREAPNIGRYCARLMPNFRSWEAQPICCPRSIEKHWRPSSAPGRPEPTQSTQSVRGRGVVLPDRAEPSRPLGIARRAPPAEGQQRGIRAAHQRVVCETHPYDDPKVGRRRLSGRLLMASVSDPKSTRPLRWIPALLVSGTSGRSWAWAGQAATRRRRLTPVPAPRRVPDGTHRQPSGRPADTRGSRATGASGQRSWLRPSARPAALQCTATTSDAFALGNGEGGHLAPQGATRKPAVYRNALATGRAIALAPLSPYSADLDPLRQAGQQPPPPSRALGFYRDLASESG